MQNNKAPKEISQNRQRIIIEGKDAILGRLGTEVAKYLMNGYIVNIINCEKVVISGKKFSILKEYREMQHKRTLSNPKRGPFHPKRPDRLVRKTIRGMLPMEKSSGRNAFHRLKTYISIPDEISNETAIKPKFADSSKLSCKKVTIGELCEEFGWQNVGGKNE